MISLVGDSQARLIDQLLRRYLPAQELIRRKILCGNSAQFEGDERDVVLLSMVTSSKDVGRRLPLLNDERFKQRFNVAASRARDQLLWVVYSLDPHVDLHEDDLRRKLIEHAWAVASGQPLINDGEADKTESPFEREVFERLVRAGYRVRSQVWVGRFRIDLVVQGRDSQIAVECDGDRWHPLERVEQDLQRQAVLERLGWRFIRIRGSQFYRDREGTIREMFAQLKRLGVNPAAVDGRLIGDGTGIQRGRR